MTVIGDAFVKVRADASGFGKDAEHGVRSQTKKLLELAGGAVAIGGAADFLKDAIGNAVTFQEQMAGLDQTLSNVGQGTDKAKRTADNYAEALSKLSGFTRVDVAASLQKATQGTGNLGKAMQVETTAANLARARHIDLKQATLIVTKAFDGNTSSLKRLGISFTPVTAAHDALTHKIDALVKSEDGATKSQKAAIVEQVKALKGQLDGAKALDKTNTTLKVQKTLVNLTKDGMKTFGETTAGKLAHVRNAVDEVQTKIGLALLPAIGKLADLGAKYVDKLDEKWPEISKAVHKEVDKVKAVLSPIKDALLSLAGPIKAVVDYFGGAETVVKDLGIAVVGFIVISKTIEVATALYEGLSAAIFLVRNAQIALDVAFEANPIGLITVALVALGAALYEAYEHSATFRNIVNKAFADVKAGAKVALDWINTVGLPALRHAFEVVKPPVLEVLHAIVGGIQTFISQVRQNWGTITSILGPPIRFAFDAVKKIVQSYVDQIKNVINLFGDILHGRWGNIWGDLVAIALEPFKLLKGLISAALTDLGPAVLSGAKIVGGKVVSGIKAGIADLPGLGEKILSAAGDAISYAARAVFNLAKRIGSLIISGIVQGVQNGAGAIASAAKHAASSALSSATGGLLGFVQTGNTLIGQIEAQTSKLGKGLAASLVSQVQGATRAAKSNLTSLTGSLAGDIGSVIDAATQRQVALIATHLATQIAGIPNTISAAVAGVAAGTSTSDASAKIAADQAAKQKRSLQAAVDAANTARDANPTDPALIQAAKDAQTDLDDYLLQAQIDLDNAKYSAAVTAAQNQAALDTQTAQDKAAQDKTAVNNAIALYTQQFNAGKITQAEYLSDITAQVAQYTTGEGADSYTNMGDLLGLAFATSFQTHLADIQAQISNIAKAGPAGTGGTGDDTQITAPIDAISSQFVTATQTLTGDNSALGKARAAVAKALAKDKSANAFKLNNFGLPELVNGTPAQAKAADAALKAAQAQLDAAEASQKRDSLLLAALKLLLQQNGVDPNAVIAAAGR